MTFLIMGSRKFLVVYSEDFGPGILFQVNPDNLLCVAVIIIMADTILQAINAGTGIFGKPEANVPASGNFYHRGFFFAATLFHDKKVGMTKSGEADGGLCPAVVTFRTFLACTGPAALPDAKVKTGPFGFIKAAEFLT